MSRYEADDGGRRSRRDRDYSPEYHSGGGGGRPFDQDNQPPPPPPQQQPQQRRGLNEDYYRESAATLGVPAPSNNRPRSVPPSSAVIRRPRSPSRSSRSSSRSYRGRGFDDDDHSRSRGGSRGPDPVSRARGIVHDNFSHSAAGIGAGILGAVVGGIVANKASEAAFKHRHKAGGRARRHSDEAAPRMVSTILGAVAGGLGANAIANRVEDSRDKGRHRQIAWEGRYGPEEDLPHYDSGRPGDLDHRNGRGRLYRGEDDDYDYVYDDDRRSSRSRAGRRPRDEEAGFRYRF
ncbi:AAA family ATPase [Purpureocillium lavendulum]|uniref:AAA family ATPase n=1 Tax=Purpureocillium lavendulum TaxID=1247861 RepID=A0AB34FRQ5_9HYPO|nr:AAA family ATPase [Purpureocillium lavendulum]